MKARLVPLVAIAAYFVAGLAWLGRHGVRGGTFTPGSIYERSGEGLSIASEYLRRRAFTVAPALDDIDARHVPKDAVVFRLRPAARTLPATITSAEHEWLSGGGRLVLGLIEDYGRLDVTALETKEQAPLVKVFPTWTGVRNLVPPVRRSLSAGLPVEAVTLFAIGARPAIVRWPVGRGEVIALSCPEIFENAHLSVGDHARLLEQLAGPRRPLLFDETAHGLTHEPGLLSLLAEWGLGPALILGLGALALALWRSHARLGAPADPHEETRSDAVDLVDSLALLYARALDEAQLLALYHDALRRRAALRTGLKGEALDARLAALTGDVSSSPGRVPFALALAALNRAFDTLEDHAHTR